MGFAYGGERVDDILGGVLGRTLYVNPSVENDLGVEDLRKARLVPSWSGQHLPTTRNLGPDQTHSSGTGRALSLATAAFKPPRACSAGPRNATHDQNQ